MERIEPINLDKVDLREPTPDDMFVRYTMHVTNKDKGRVQIQIYTRKQLGEGQPPLPPGLYYNVERTWKDKWARKSIKEVMWDYIQNHIEEARERQRRKEEEAETITFRV